VPFGGPENQILHFDPIFPQKPQIFGQFSTGLKISRQKGLSNGDARLQTTLNRHRSPMKVV